MTSLTGAGNGSGLPMSTAPQKIIQEIQFGIFSPEEVKKMSVVEIIYPDIIDEATQKPREQGLGDPKMGSIDRAFRCASCGENSQTCPGHFGHMELAEPVYHPGFMRKIQKLLEIVCHSCGKILADENRMGFNEALRHRDPKRRFEAIHKISKTITACSNDTETTSKDADNPTKEKEEPKMPHGGCGNAHPRINKKEGLKLIATWKGIKTEDDEKPQDEKREIKPQEAQEIFRRITDEELRVLGLNTAWARPEWMIISILPVPPPPVRPGVSMDGSGSGGRSEDDLTHKLGDIIRANAAVRRCIQEGSPQHTQDQFFSLLQYHVATLMDNAIAGVPAAKQKAGRDLKTIRSRLKGKEGRLRGNLMGKRVNFSARTVITGDPNLDLDQLGVPLSVARILTFPEVVTPFNISRLHALVRNGPNVHPGARFIERDNGDRIDLRHHKRLDSIQLGYGWKVERHLMDGDYVIFNRQPSLHKESMMGHRVKVLPFSTFRLNLSVTTPYNADFDGDEMNLHAPQSQETRAEIQEICAVPLNIVSPQRNGPLMGIVQDSLCGMYKMCRKDNFLNKDQVMNILPWVPDWDGVVPSPAIVKPVARWTGKQIISLALPEGLNLGSGEAVAVESNKTSTVIRQGELLYGLLFKKNVGVGSGGVIHNVYNELGWEAAVKFFNAAQRIVAYWLLHNGFSIGIGDTVPDDKTAKAIEDCIIEQKQKVEEITKLATQDMLDSLPGMNLRGTFESKVQKELNDAREKAGNVTENSLKILNNAAQMSKSGSKGSQINISQMTALVGQQAVEGKRVPFGFSYRTLPHFTKDDYSPEARGFVENSYLKGLTPQEFFFHAMAGREGLIDTAVKTAETGYIQRRLVKALEDVMVKYDGTVRNSLGDIIEFVYGEDGMDGQYIERQNVDIIKCSDIKFEKMFRIDVTGANEEYSLTPDVLELADDITGDNEVQALFDAEFEQLEKDREMFRDAMLSSMEPGEDDFQLPLNIMRTIRTAQSKFRIRDGSRSDLDPKEAIPKVQRLLDNLVVIRGDDPLTIEAQHSATMLFKALVRSRLAFKRLVKDYSLNKLALDNVLGEIENRFLRAQASPGEMVGVLAAQSIGEPATQMTLNTFHFTGIASKNVTLGVPRLKEILNVAMNLKTPAMSIYQLPENRNSQAGAKDLRSKVEHTSLRSLTAATEIVYDPDITTTVVDEDKDMVEAYFIIPDDEILSDNQSRFVLRLVLDPTSLYDKDLSISEVATRVKEEFKDGFVVLHSDDNAEIPVIRIRMLMRDEKDDEPTEEDVLLRKLSDHMMKEVTVRGVPGIEKAFIDQKTVPIIDDDGRVLLDKEDPRCKEYFLNTTGTSFRAVLQVAELDPTRVYTNSFSEIVDVLGIEACRAALARELWAVLSFDGSYVNHRHLAILVDVMCTRGFMMAITRHGINRADTGALMRCSFEETVEILLDAAAAGEIDDCRGVSENVMLGQLAPLGTGEMEIYADQEMLSTAATDNQRFGIAPQIATDMGMGDVGGSATPYDPGSPMQETHGAPDYGASSFSPLVEPGMEDSRLPDWGQTPLANVGGASPYHSQSPFYQPTSPRYGGASPSYSPSTPSATSPYTSMYGGASPYGVSPSSPAFTPGSGSPSHLANQSSPSYSPTSPSYSPASPRGYSPTSPSYSPTSPAMNPALGRNRFSPTSPAAFSPGATSPAYSPGSPAWQPKDRPAAQSTSPAYSPSSPQYNPTSFTTGSGLNDQNSPTSPAYSPASPAYSPTSPSYDPSSSKK